MSKAILYCADGTWNGPGDPANTADIDASENPDPALGPVTNVVKLFKNLEGAVTAETQGLPNEQEKVLNDGTGAGIQVAKYMHGVGDSSDLVWFAGCHSDVGGGYASAECGLSNLALNWMMEQLASLEVPFASPLPVVPDLTHYGLGQGGSRIAHWIVAALLRQIRLETPTTHEYNHHDSETQMVCPDRR
jgi:hypothetical protein